MERQPVAPEQMRGRSCGDELVGPVADLQSALTDLLGAADDDPRRLDANSEWAHQLITDIYRLIRRTVFGSAGPLDPVLYKQTYDAFTATREAESDMYEVYANDLECYRRRAARDLGVAESDSDRLALVSRRREYIPKLAAFQLQTAAILEFLQEGHAGASPCC
jgi:hypothetical protein